MHDVEIGLETDGPESPNGEAKAAQDPKIEAERARVADDDVVARLARRLGYVFVRDLSEFPVDPAAWELIPPRIIRRHRAVPIGFDEQSLVVAVADPTNVVGLDDIRTMTGRDLKVIVARPAEIDDVISRLDRFDRSAETFLDEAAGLEEEEEEITLDADDAPIVKAINRIISQAVQQRASDVHVEPQEFDVRIRYRIDGVLQEAMRTKKSLQPGLISRLKVMADLDIAEKRVPQDGRVSVKVEGRTIDLRVATLPTSWGEKVVLRVLDQGQTVKDLVELGFGPEPLMNYRSSVAKTHGAVLLTGPTGSGKSTTLYATLQSINDPTKNIVTVEDPIESRLAGLSQMQINPRAGLTFATALRSILRGDPDIVMVGEMRDRETALIGIESALTGHLVLSTLHTNDAPSAITRLIEMGIEPFLVASAVECVVAQRLARKLCPKCAVPYTPTAQMLKWSGIPYEDEGELPTLMKHTGCTYCAKTGFRGRVALVEVMPMSDELRKFTVERRSADEIKRQAIAEGMRVLRDDGMQKAIEGVTTVEEVLRVVA